MSSNQDEFYSQMLSRLNETERLSSQHLLELSHGATSNQGADLRPRDDDHHSSYDPNALHKPSITKFDPFHVFDKITQTQGPSAMNVTHDIVNGGGGGEYQSWLANANRYSTPTQASHSSSSAAVLPVEWIIVGLLGYSIYMNYRNVISRGDSIFGNGRGGIFQDRQSAASLMIILVALGVLVYVVKFKKDKLGKIGWFK